MRVVCAGHVNWDVTLVVDELPVPDGETAVRTHRQAGGGSAANTAAGLAGLGVGAGLVGSVGTDDNGLFARRDLERAGVDLGGLHEAEGETAVKYLVVSEGGEVMVLGTEGVNEAIGPGDVDPDYVREAAHCHLTSQRPDTAARIASVADDAGCPVSFDPGRRVDERDYGAVLAHVDLLFVNEREADLLDPPTGATVVTTRGGAGATVETGAGTHHHPGFGIDPVDTTGAGDAFAAGFLAARLDGAGYGRALAVGNACGALVASEAGARVALSWEAVERVLERDD